MWEYFFLFLFSEYVKVIDGNGVIVFNRYGYSSAPQIPYLEVLFGNSGNITVQIYLSSSYSIFKLRFGILKQGLQSGELFSFNVYLQFSSCLWRKYSFDGFIWRLM